MKKSINLFIIVLLLLTFTAIPISKVQANNTVAILKEVTGDVQITIQGGKNVFNAYNGITVRQGDSLITGKNSSVTIDFGAGNESVLGEYGKITLAELSDTSGNLQNEIRILSAHSGKNVSVKQESGGLWSKVKNLFGAGNRHRVETSTAIMGVRGTLYLTSVDPLTGEANVSVLDGAVEVGKAKGIPVQNVMITPGQGAFVKDTAIDVNMINYKGLVETTDAVLVAKMIIDTLEVAKQRVEDAQTANDAIQNGKNKESVTHVIELAVLAELAATISEKVIEGTKTSNKAQDVNQLLLRNQQSLEKLEQETKSLTEQLITINTQLKEQAKEVGLSESDIKQITDKIIKDIQNVIIENNPTSSPPTSGGGGSGSDGPISNDPINQYIRYATYQKDIKSTGSVYSLNIVFKENIDPTKLNSNKIQISVNNNVYQLKGNYVQGDQDSVAKGTYSSIAHEGYTEMIFYLTDTDRVGIETIRGANHSLQLNFLDGWYLNHTKSSHKLPYIELFQIQLCEVSSGYELSWNYSGDTLVYKVYGQPLDLDNPKRILPEHVKSTTFMISEIGDPQEIYIGVYKQNSDTLVAWGYVFSP